MKLKDRQFQVGVFDPTVQSTFSSKLPDKEQADDQDTIATPKHGSKYFSPLS